MEPKIREKFYPLPLVAGDNCLCKIFTRKLKK